MTPHAVHAGPVSVIEMYNDRVWTSGSGALAGSLLEWDLTGQSHAETDITRIGQSRCAAPLLQSLTSGCLRGMHICACTGTSTPFLSIPWWHQSQDLNSAPQAVLAARAPGLKGASITASCAGPMTALAVLPLMSASRKEDSDPATVGTSELKDWILASAHQSGAIVLWDPHANTCAMPVVYLHPATGPCRYYALQSWRSCTTPASATAVTEPLLLCYLSQSGCSHHCDCPAAS